MENSNNLNAKILLTISFIEGAVVMIVELLGAKIVAPFYGNSLYVWASVLGVTLGALAFGYYSGGYISKYKNPKKALGFILLVGAIFTFVMPKLAPAIMNALSSAGVRVGSALSVFSYLFIPVACMGMVSPIITHLLNNHSKNAGFSAGKVYAISTIGGIIATFLSGFYLIPEFGIKTTAISTSLILFVLSIFVFFKLKNKPLAVINIILLLALLTLTSTKAKKDSNTIIQYQSSGVLGEWTVVDQLAMVSEGEKLYTRHLLLNWVDQTYTQASNPTLSLWNYAHRLSALAGVKPEGSRALLLGMGGGSICFNLSNLGFEIDVVELDERIPKIAKKWFNYNPKKTTKTIIDDARHYIRNTDKNYDVVVLDLLNGEEQPAHVFTTEGLDNLKRILNKNAIVIINFQGLLDPKRPEASLPVRSIAKTFKSSGYNIKICDQFNNDNPELSDDVLMYGSLDELTVYNELKENIRYNDLYPYEQFHFNINNFKEASNVNLDDAIIFTDDKMNLNILNNSTVVSWRQKKIDVLIKSILEKDLPLFQ